METYKLPLYVYNIDYMGQNEEKPRKKFRRTAQDTYPISTRVTNEMMDAIDKILETGNYLRVSDYLRDLIRKDLESRNVSP
ncbi:MAG: ribbon-helix-helix domain-containing protein [Proteobacteria bacterium]|nr:ribbon-helix-helix domain-containing protein [Pseudomonadota bacterium]